MGLSAEQYEIGKEELLAILRAWDAKDPAHPVIDNQGFDRWLERVQHQGWTRRDVYDLFRAIEAARPRELSEATIEQLAEAEDGVTGNCHEDYIFRFPDDPSDKAEFVAYVRSNRWR